VSAARKVSWIERHDATIRELAWLGAVAGAPHPSTVASPEHGPEGRGDGATAQAAPEPAADAAWVAEAEAALATLTAERDAARADRARALETIAALTAELDAQKGSAARLAVTMRDDAERELVRLAVTVAERVVGREVETEPSLVAAWAREAIAGSEIGDHLEIAISADLADTLGAEDWGDLANLVATDPSLPEATAEVRDGGRAITVSASERLELVAEPLLSAVRTEAA